MGWIGDNHWEMWLGLAILLGVAEMFSLDLVLGMLAIGALVGLLATGLGAGLALSALLAAGGAAACLLVLRPPLVRRLHSGPDLVTGHRRLIGEQGVVTEPVSALNPGRVKVSGQDWSAKPYDETLVIEPGQTVEILDIRGATAYVHPLPQLGP
jgi:membrane protein implicated in regulation of membrane protease activity